MRTLFSNLYNKVIAWSQHRHAPYYLAGVSFAESSVFPIPPDVMLIPMAIAKPNNAWRYAAVCTAFSILGGLLGYTLGMLAYPFVEPYFIAMGHGDMLTTVQTWFVEYGFWIVLLAGFTPIPYKLFTISAGLMHMALLPFMIASIVGRAARFYLVAAGLYFGGEHIDRFLKDSVDRLGWIIIACVVVFWILW